MKDFFEEMDPEFVNLVMDLDIENFDAVLKDMAQTWRKFHSEKFPRSRGRLVRVLCSKYFALSSKT